MICRAAKRWLLPLALLAIAHGVNSQEWEDPYFETILGGPGNVQENSLIGPILQVFMDEAVSEPVPIAFLIYKGTSEPILTPLLGSLSTLGLEAKPPDAPGDNWTLVVYNALEVDLETSNSLYNVKITVPGDPTQGELQISVRNINDNPPYFDLSTMLPCEVEEGHVGPTNCEFRIKDLDGVNEDEIVITAISEGRPEYKFDFETRKEGEDLLATLIVLEDSAPFDYETVSLHRIIVTATEDNTPEDTGEANIILSVKDVSDTKPIWTIPPKSTLTVREENEEIMSFSARDGDMGVDDKIIYEIINATPPESFELVDTADGADLIIKETDRDTSDDLITLTVTVRAYEEKDPDSYIEELITVIITDENDNSPELNRPNFFAEVPEGTLGVITFEESIQVTDPDLGNAGQFSLELRDDSGNNWASAFSVIPSSGYRDETFTINVINQTLLDYEDPIWNTITMTMMDPTHTAEALISINVTAIFDESPQFEKNEYMATVPEDSQPGASVITVKATDGDEGDTITYRITTRTNAVKIDSASGLVTVNDPKALDYEQQNELTVQIEAKDSGNLLDFTDLIITISDVNDVFPILEIVGEQPSVEENSPADTKIDAGIKATDPDTMADLQFSIDWPNSYATLRGIRVETGYENCVRIETEDGETPDEKLGNIYVEPTPPLDSEKFDTLYLKIKVTDENGLPTPQERTGVTNIAITNINDNSPTFKPESLQGLRVLEGVPNQLIGFVVATDPEMDPIDFSIIEIENTPPGLVSINNETGELKTINDQVDAEANGSVLKYTITASDGVFSTDAELTITVDDANDNSPEFTNDLGPFDILENSSEGLIVTLTATDADVSDPYGKNLEYSLDPTALNYSIYSQMFAIDKTTGEMTISGTEILDREKYPIIEVGVLCEDNKPPTSGVPGNSNSRKATITIILKDENDEYPDFGENVHDEISIQEDTMKDDVIYATVVAPDADEPGTINSIVTYEATNTTGQVSSSCPWEAQELFSVVDNGDDKTASIFAAVDLKGCYGEFILTIKASDKNQEPKSSTAEYPIVIEDLNDNPPYLVFPTSEDQIRIDKIQVKDGRVVDPNGINIIPFTAADLDDINGVNGQVNITITGDDNAKKYFYLSDAGINQAFLMCETEIEDGTPIIKLTLEVIDGGSTPLRNTTTTNVYIIDDSDQKPTFGSDITEIVEWKENESDLKAIVGSATDPNNIGRPEEDYEKIYYHIVDNSEGDKSQFDLNKDNCELSVKSELDREEYERHVLLIVATNSADPPSVWDPTQELTVTVNVQDEVDSQPHFVKQLYVGGIAPFDGGSIEVTRVIAEDEDDLSDPNNGDTLEYEILLDTMEASTPELRAVMLTAFNLETVAIGQGTTDAYYEGRLTTTFSPTDKMEGYFEFMISVKDKAGFKNETTMQVYIISADNRVFFIFANSEDEVNENREFIAQVFTDNLNYECSIDGVVAGNGEFGTKAETGNVSTVSTHFIDVEKQLPVEAQEIEKLASNPETLGAMQQELNTRDLILVDIRFIDTSEKNLVAILSGLLIGVGVILGLLVIVLFTAYIYKTKSLKRRLEALSTTKFGSQESGLNRIAMNVPNTNRHAVEGSNPVWNEEVLPYDAQSQGSGDSELIGVEDNPEFNYDNKDEDAERMRDSQEGGYYSGSDIATAAARGLDQHIVSTEL